MTKLFKLPQLKALKPPYREELLKLVRLLRFGTSHPTHVQAPALNYTAIAAILGLSRDRVRVLLA